MDNQIINKAIGIVTQAIQADNNGDHRAAYDLYTRALEHFMLGLKCACEQGLCVGACIMDAAWLRRRLSHPPVPHPPPVPRCCVPTPDETNPSARDVILKKLQGYMTRAEQLKKSLDSASPAAAAAASGGTAEAKAGDSKEDSESKKLQGALASM